MEDALDAPQRLLAPRGDAVKSFVIVLQGPTTLAGGEQARHTKRKQTITLFLQAKEAEVLPKVQYIKEMEYSR